MILILLLIPAACLACFLAGYEIGRSVEHFEGLADRDRREP